jgi:hypothetical protein
LLALPVEVLLNYRLAPDMLPFVRQIQIAVAASQGAMWTIFKEIIASRGFVGIARQPDEPGQRLGRFVKGVESCPLWVISGHRTADPSA